ncbi:MAG: VCBS repeat-containing protein [Planctomycetia bacterium]|nr:VCBS repeat-containing protein [Planctomycetia bacterium]
MRTLLAALLMALPAAAQDYKLHSFSRQQLTNIYYSEGANAGDLNGDGKPDVVYGPYWFEGPDFNVKHELYPAKPQNKEGYADNFFNWIHDFNGDGRPDVLTVGFPGKPGYVYENPGKDGFDKPWKRHEVLKSVSNESPQFLNLVGDATPELVCTSNGQFGYASFEPKKGCEPWTFHAISVMPAPKPFGHGLGAGDINGDGLMDIIIFTGWFEQPKDKADSVRWEFHEAKFTTAYGGAEMYAYDVDGDGLNDVITSDAAHDFGLDWYQQSKVDGKITFQRNRIMGNKPADNPFGVVFSELHSVALVDLDGDGLKDIVTGKTYYSHHKGSPMWDAGAVVYWFKLERTKKGVEWIPHKLDGEAGIGRQISIVDVNGDKLPDIVVGGMVGAHVLTHKVEAVSKEKYDAAQPKRMAFAPPKSIRGPLSVIDAKTGRVADALEGEEMRILKTTAGKAGVQKMAGFKADTWSGGAQLFWSGGKKGETLTLEFESKAGTFELVAVMTMANDYAIVQFGVDDKPLGKPIDFYHPEVVTSGLQSLGKLELKEGSHHLTLTITGANPAAAPKYMVGLDYLLLKPAK